MLFKILYLLFVSKSVNAVKNNKTSSLIQSYSMMANRAETKQSKRNQACLQVVRLAVLSGAGLFE